jgi:hypothetical protein
MIPMPPSSGQFAKAIRLIDQANSADPTIELNDGHPYPKALLYSRRMTQCLERFEPTANEALCLAARAQHICRWEIPRETYPADRAGYRAWRERLYVYHADKTERILRQVGYDEATIITVRDLLQKQRLKADPRMQTLEDVICLVFLEYYLAEFACQHTDEHDKLVNILSRTWKKMSPRGHAAALQLPLDPALRAFLESALGPAAGA